MVDGVPYRRPEQAAAAVMRSEDWICSTCEAGPMLHLMKSACLDLLISMNRLGPADSLTRFFEAQVTINRERVDEIGDAIGAADTPTVVRNFERIYAAGVNRHYPGVSVELIERLHVGLALKLSAIFERFAADSYCYRAGWPDLTAVRGDAVRFREVKTSDKLHESQLETLGAVLQPCGLSVDVVQLVKQPKTKPA